MGICKQFLVSFLLSLMMQAGGQRINIPVSGNWQLGAGSSEYQLPDGTKVIKFGYSSGFSQDLGVTPRTIQQNHNYNYYKASDGVYTLTFTLDNDLQVYPGSPDVEIDFGSQKLCDSYLWGLTAFTTITIVCPSPEYLIDSKALPDGGPVQSFNDLVLKFSNTEWPLLLKADNVSLTFTPTN